MSAIQQHLDKLQVPNTSIRQYAVAAIFNSLRSPGISLHARDAAVRQCLQLKDEKSLQVAVSHLLQLVLAEGGLDNEDGVDFLLTALSVAEARTCRALVQGLLSLWSWTCMASSAGLAHGQSSTSSRLASLHISSTSGLNTSAVAAGWRRHPLVRALLAHPAAAEPVVQGVLSLLAGAACKAASLQNLLQAAHPFLGFVLLSPELRAQHPTLSVTLHAGLARCACCASSADAQHALLALLVGYLPAHGAALPGPGEHLSAVVGDVMDVVGSCEAEPDGRLLEELVRHLITLCYDRAQHGGSMQPLLSALHFLAQAWPSLVGVCVGDVAQLVALTGGEDCAGVMALLARQLDFASKAGGVHPALRAWVVPPLLQILAFQQETKDGPVLRQWASHNLALLPPPDPPSSTRSAEQSWDVRGTGGGGSAGVGGEPPSAWGSDSPADHSSGQIPLWGGQGPAAVEGVALHMLQRFWADPRQARGWLGRVGSSLQALAGGGQHRGGVPPGGREQRTLFPPAQSVLCALLYHPDQDTQLAAVRTLEVAVQAVPLLGMAVLPILMHRAEQLVEGFLAGRAEHPPLSLLPTLRTIPLLAQHAAVVPFVVRALQPLLSPGAPELLHAVALRLLCLLWRRTGRGYQHLRAAILGFASPGVAPGLDLRISRAESLREICEEDPGKGVELIKAVQECLGDAAPQVQALGLGCISLLCEADSLDFYKAWRVVQARFPSLPDHPNTAAAWVELMGQGVLDADMYPEVAKKIVEALWLATDHAAPQVRYQAYCSLSAYTCGLLEQIEALPPLIDYVQLLQLEHCPTNRPVCEDLVIAALRHEHATRRRPGSALGASKNEGRGARRARNPRPALSDRDDSSVTTHRLLATLPKLLLGGSAGTATDVLQRLQELPAGAVLCLYAPPGPASATPAATAAAAKDAAASYHLLFGLLVRQPIAAQLSSSGDPAGTACLAAWRCFIKRWAGALRAAGSMVGGADVAAPDATSAASSSRPVEGVWAEIQPLLSAASPQVVENAAWAAAGLCGVGEQPVREVVHAVHAALTGIARSAQAPAAASRAATLALGCQTGIFRQVLGDASAASLVGHLVESSAENASALSRGAAAQALGMLCQSITPDACGDRGVANPGRPPAQSSKGLDSGDVAAGIGNLLTQALTSLLSMLCLLCQSSGTANRLQGAVAEAGLLDTAAFNLDQSDREGGELLLCVCAGLAHAVPAMAAMDLCGVLCALHDTLLCMLRQPQQHAPQHAACSLLAPLAAAGFQRGWLSSDSITATLDVLLGLLGGSAAGSERGGNSGAGGLAGGLDGRVVGGAAAALGELLPAVMSRGYSPASSLTLEVAVQELVRLSNSAAGRAFHAAAAKQGISAGIAQLLAPPAGLPPGSRSFRPALSALEELALRDDDPRARKACGAVLATLCYRFRKGASRGTGAAGEAPVGGVGQGGKSLSALPEEGALRPLVESLLAGTWSEAISGSGDGGGGGEPGGATSVELSAAEVACALRCLAAAPRLPALPFDVLCRRVLRGHGGDADVEQGCVQLAAAHGQVHGCQLVDFISETLHPSSFKQLQPSSQVATLRALPCLLRALPDRQAAAALGALCASCPDLSGGAAGDIPRLVALLNSLQQLLGQQQQQERGGGSMQSSAFQQPPAAVAPEVDAVAQEALVKVVLPRLPSPGTLPLINTCSRTGGAAHKIPASASADSWESDLSTVGARSCWQAAVECFQSLPVSKLERLIEDPQLSAQLPLRSSFLAASLVATGALGQRALQPSRNLLLTGVLLGGPPPGPAEGGEGDVALAVGRAVATLPPPQQQQWAMDVLDAATACAHPGGALKLACCIIASAASSAALAMPAPELAAEHVIAGSCRAAVLTLGRNLLLLGEAAGWAGPVVGGILARLTHAVAAAVHADGTHSKADAAFLRAGVSGGSAGPGAEGAQRPEPGDGTGGGGEMWGRVARSALAANRQVLLQEQWETLAAWMTQHAVTSSTAGTKDVRQSSQALLDPATALG